MNLDQMVADASKRVEAHINRSAGQHLRAYKSYKCADPRPTDRELITDIAWAHSVSFSEAASWLSTIDFEALK